MPMANSTARYMMFLPNSDPISTMSVEKPASSANVFAVFACGFHVIGYLLQRSQTH